MAFEDGDEAPLGGAAGAWPGLSPAEQAALAKAPKRAGWRDAAGKAWNLPNTALGLAYGGLGMAAGEAGYLLGLQRAPPRISLRDNAVQFTNNPFGGPSAVTLGNATVWREDPYDPDDRYWHDATGNPMLENGHTYPEHETQHTYQGQQLGPFYLPSNLLGGVNSMLHGTGWHGDANWNETGPQQNPPRPWPPRRR